MHNERCMSGSARGHAKPATARSPRRAWPTRPYIRTWEGWLYLAVVMDLFSRKIVGWAMRPTIHRGLVLDAVMMAVKRRRPRGTVIHSDQGCQYGSDDWRRFCRKNRLEPSMSRRGNCRDNAVAESFFASLKKERIKKRIYNTRDMATIDISDYIESFYNPRRIASRNFVTRCLTRDVTGASRPLRVLPSGRTSCSLPPKVAEGPGGDGSRSPLLCGDILGQSLAVAD